MNSKLIRGKESMLQPSDNKNHIISQQTKRKRICYLPDRMHIMTFTTFNLRLDKHSKDTEKPGSILSCKHFHQKEHNFNKHAKFIIIDKLISLQGSKETLIELFVGPENFCIQKLKTLVPFGLNQELSKTRSTAAVDPGI